MTGRRLSGPRYPGGKNGNSSTGTGRWVAEVLPVDAHVYVEPFAGHLGVLLQRPPATKEIVNDLDQAAMNFWRVVRDLPEELERRLYNTPAHRGEFKAARARLAEPRPPLGATEAHVRWAADYVTVKHQSMSALGGTWAVTATGASGGSSRWPTPAEPDKIRRLADRLRDVVFECEDALKIIRYSAGSPAALIYCDPPYRTTLSGYDHEVDQDRFERALLDAKARIAVSGVPGDRPILEDDGWRRYDRGSYRTMGIHGRQDQTWTPQQVVESLWCNFDLPESPKQGELL